MAAGASAGSETRGFTNRVLLLLSLISIILVSLPASGLLTPVLLIVLLIIVGNISGLVLILINR